LVTHDLALLPPVINQSIQRTPLTAWSTAGFAFIILAAGYLGWRRSVWVMLAIAVTVPFAGYRDIAQTTLTVPKCVTFGSAFGLLLSGINPWPRSLAARRLIVIGGVLLVSIALSAVSAPSEWLVAREFFKQAEYVVVLWCAVACLENIPGSQRTMITGVGLATAIVGSFALIQALAGGAPSAVLVNGHVVPRVAGTLEGPNQLAGFLEAALPALWVAMLGEFGWPGLSAYAIASGTSALVLSQSRAGVVMAAIAYGVLWRLWRAAAKAAAPWAAIGLAFGAALLYVWFVFFAHAGWGDVERYFLLDVTPLPGGVGTRAQLWPAALALFARHPVLGVGAGNFPLLLPTVGVTGVATGASSLWLQTLAEQGIVGVAALAAFAWIALRETFRLRAQSPLALAAFLASFSLLAHQVVDDLFFYPKVAALFWLVLGAGAAGVAPTTSRPAPSGTGAASGAP
jgi:hypothetical protein